MGIIILVIFSNTIIWTHFFYLCSATTMLYTFERDVVSNICQRVDPVIPTRITCLHHLLHLEGHWRAYHLILMSLVLTCATSRSAVQAESLTIPSPSLPVPQTEPPSKRRRVDDGFSSQHSRKDWMVKVAVPHVRKAVHTLSTQSYRVNDIATRVCYSSEA